MNDADLGLFGPGSVTWRVHADPTMLVGGLRALLIQALHPLAMAGVDQHSDYRTDAWGRLRRTTEYVLETTFADTATAVAAGQRVQAVHEHVRGVDPVTGKTYWAGDPELLLWVHNVEVHSFLAAYRRYGGWLPDGEADRYVAEMVRAAELVGVPGAMVPATTADLRDYLRGVDGLAVTAISRGAMHMVLNPPMPLPARPLWAVPAAAAVGLLPSRIRALYGLRWFTPADPAVRVAGGGLFRVLNLVFPGAPQVREARARAKAA